MRCRDSSVNILQANGQRIRFRFPERKINFCPRNGVQTYPEATQPLGHNADDTGLKADDSYSYSAGVKNGGAVVSLTICGMY
jgi:hypothetical protein